MDYDPNIMPRNEEELEICANHYFQLGMSEYNEKVANATKEAKAAYLLLPDSEDKPVMEEYIKLSLSRIPRPMTLEEWKEHFISAGYGIQAPDLL